VHEFIDLVTHADCDGNEHGRQPGHADQAQRPHQLPAQRGQASCLGCHNGMRYPTPRTVCTISRPSLRRKLKTWTSSELLAASPLNPVSSASRSDLDTTRPDRVISASSSAHSRAVRLTGLPPRDTALALESISTEPIRTRGVP